MTKMDDSQTTAGADGLIDVHKKCLYKAKHDANAQGKAGVAPRAVN